NTTFGKELTEELQGVNPPPGNAEQLGKELANEHAALAYFAPRGAGLNAWSGDEKAMTKTRRRFMLLGRTLDGMRVWDIRRAVQALSSIQASGEIPITLQGRGDMAGVALYASLYENAVKHLDLFMLPKSHAEGPELLNVLRIL